MKIEKLRIGNFVQVSKWSKNNIGQVDAIDWTLRNERYVAVRGENFCIHVLPEDISGIPLNDELLLKLGFEYSDKEERYIRQFSAGVNLLSLRVDTSCNTLLLKYKDNWIALAFASNVKYLHQLQNFAEDNDIKLEVKL